MGLILAILIKAYCSIKHVGLSKIIKQTLLQHPSWFCTNSKHISFFCLHLRWKYDGPSDSFKALIDMAAVHSSCRLCIHIATKIHLKEEMTPKFTNRPCSCSSKKGTVYHLFVRERGRFKSESIYMRYGSLTVVLPLYF